MELFIHLTDLKHYDSTYHRETNTDTIKDILDSGEIPEDIHIINEVPEMDFCQEFTIEGKNDLLWFPVKQILMELIDSNSALNGFFGTREADNQEKAELFIRIWEQCFKKLLGRITYSRDENTTDYDIFYGDPLVDEIGILGGEARGKTFRASIPNDVIKKYYPNPECYISELEEMGFQQFMDVVRFEKDDFIKYIASEYYLELSDPFRKKLREDKAEMEYLMYNWVRTLFAGLH